VNVWLSCELEPNKNIEISIFANVLNQTKTRRIQKMCAKFEQNQLKTF